MKNIFRTSAFLIFTLLLLNSCTSSLQNKKSNRVESISDATVTMEDGHKVSFENAVDESKTTIILVRHAEKRKDEKDPNLTTEGKQRAERLQEILAKVKIDKVYSTDYRRTQQTAIPVAQAKKLAIESYDPSDLTAFGKMILEKHRGQNILVVGHSNTTPTLMNILMQKEAVKEIDESDYENLFLINIVEGKKPKEMQLKF